MPAPVSFRGQKGVTKMAGVRVDYDLTSNNPLAELRKRNIAKLTQQIPGMVIPVKKATGRSVQMTKKITGQDDLEIFSSIT